MARKKSPKISSGYTLLVVDDDRDYLLSTSILLEREGHTIITCDNGNEALAILKKEPIDLVLLDYFMPGMTGEEVIIKLREFNQQVQVILQTGYASEKPPREMLKRLDIQGYYNKTDGPDDLLLWTEVGLKAVYTTQLLIKSKQSLQIMLNVPQDIKRTKPLTELLQGTLWQICGLYNIIDAFIAVRDDRDNDKFELNAKSDLRFFASSGRFRNISAENNSSEIVQIIEKSIQADDISATQTETIIPLRIGELSVGVIYLDKPIRDEDDQKLLTRFAKKAAIAVQHSMVYEKILTQIKN